MRFKAPQLNMKIAFNRASKAKRLKVKKMKTQKSMFWVQGSILKAPQSSKRSALL